MEIQISRKASKELDKIPEPIFSNLRKKIESLSHNPTPPNSKRLTNWAGYRLRVGDYRILYEVVNEKETVIIYRVAHRKDAYR